MPNTFDICDKLNNKVFNDDINNLEIYKHFLNFEKELTNYLLDKMIFFELEATFVTIEKDIPTILSYINELLPDKKSKKIFFYNISLYLVQYISIAFNNDYRYLLKIDNDEYIKTLYIFEFAKNSLKLFDNSKVYTKFYQ